MWNALLTCETQRNAACDNLRQEQLRTARILAMHDHQTYAYDHRSPLSPPSTTHSASPWTKYDRAPLCSIPRLPLASPVAGPSSLSPHYGRPPLFPPAVHLLPERSLSTPISPSNSTASAPSAGTTKSKAKRKMVEVDERPLGEIEKEEETPKPIHDHATVMNALKARVLRNQEATRIAALNPPAPLEPVKPAKRKELSPTTKSTPRVTKSKSPSTSIKIKEESPSSAVALTVAPEERSSHHSKPSNSLQSLLNAVAVSPFVSTGYATSDMRSS